MKQKKKRIVKWHDSFYVRCYELARGGFSDRKIAKFLCLSALTLDRWREENESLEEAITRGRAFITNPDGNPKTFVDYCFSRMPEEMQDLWLEIADLECAENPVLAIEEVLRTRGVRARQHLFLFAWIASNFSTNYACKKMNIDKTTFDYWVEHDPEFTKLFDEMNWQKGNFFEEHLTRLVASGDVPSTIFANSTYNKDRGYGKQETLKIQTEVKHTHTFIDIEQLNLPLEILMKIRDAHKKTLVLEQTSED